MAEVAFTQKQLASMGKVLNGDYASLNEAAQAALSAAFALIEERANYIVVGQVTFSREKGWLKPSDPAATKIALGLYETPAKAESAARSLASAPGGDQLKVWVLPLCFDPPAVYHTEKRDYYANIEQRDAEKKNAKIRESIEKRNVAMEQVAKEMREADEVAGQAYPCASSTIRDGLCRHPKKCR